MPSAAIADAATAKQAVADSHALFRPMMPLRNRAGRGCSNAHDQLRERSAVDLVLNIRVRERLAPNVTAALPVGSRRALGGTQPAQVHACAGCCVYGAKRLRSKIVADPTQPPKVQKSKAVPASIQLLAMPSAVMNSMGFGWPSSPAMPRATMLDPVRE